MAASQLQNARRLITEKRYDEARALLHTLKDDPTARKWLMKLDEIAPETPEIVKEKSPKDADINIIPSISLILLVVVFGLVLYGIAMRPKVVTESQVHDTIQSVIGTSIDDVNVKIDELASTLKGLEDNIDKNETSTDKTWQYLSFQYSQFDLFTSNGTYELASTDNALYNDFIARALPCDLSNLFSENTINCLIRNSHGSTYYLNAFGEDGWELISVIDKSTQYIYSVEMILKRSASLSTFEGLNGLGGISS